MINYKKNCSVCTRLKGPKGKKILERIYSSTWFNPTGKESLRKIQMDHKDDFSYESLTNHVKKHQFISESAKDQAFINSLQQKAEQEIIQKVVNHVQVRELVMDKGYEGIASGNIELKASDVLAASRDQMNYESKRVDQQLAMMDMVYHYTSGESTKPGAFDELKLKGRHGNQPILEGEALPNNDPAPEFAGYFDKGAGGPGPVYQRTPGDAPPPRPDNLPDGDPEETSQEEYPRPVEPVG